MSWLKVDDRFPHHIKIEKLRSLCKSDAEFTAAITVWTLMGADCSGRSHDGSFTMFRARCIVPIAEKTVVRACEQLAECGLFDHARDGGQFHDFNVYNATPEEEAERRAKLEAVSAARREAGRKGGQQTASKRQANGKQVPPAIAQANGKQTVEANLARASADASRAPASRPVPTRSDHLQAADAQAQQTDQPDREPGWWLEWLARIREFIRSESAGRLDAAIAGERERGLVKLAKSVGVERMGEALSAVCECLRDDSGHAHLRAQYRGPLALAAMLGKPSDEGDFTGDGLFAAARIATEWIDQHAPPANGDGDAIEPPDDLEPTYSPAANNGSAPVTLEQVQAARAALRGGNHG